MLHSFHCLQVIQHLLVVYIARGCCRVSGREGGGGGVRGGVVDGTVSEQIVHYLQDKWHSYCTDQSTMLKQKEPLL